MSTGTGFCRTLIYPTKTIEKYLKDGLLTKKVKKNGKEIIKDAFDIAKFCVAVTRAKHSVGIVYEYDEDTGYIEGIMKYKVKKN